MSVQKVWIILNTALSFKNITNTVKHGGVNVMVWRAMTSSVVEKCL